MVIWLHLKSFFATGLEPGFFVFVFLFSTATRVNTNAPLVHFFQSVSLYQFLFLFYVYLFTLSISLSGFLSLSSFLISSLNRSICFSSNRSLITKTAETQSWGKKICWNEEFQRFNHFHWTPIFSGNKSFSFLIQNNFFTSPPFCVPTLTGT